MLKPGTRAPAFELHDDQGQTQTLDGLLTDGPLILYFYPADFTPGCTKEACSFRDVHADLVDAGLRVVGISPQGSSRHADFRSKYSLPFPLLADPDKQAVKAYGVDGPLGMGVRRVTYLIAPDGTIKDAVQADLRIGRHTEFVQRMIKEYRQVG